MARRLADLRICIGVMAATVLLVCIASTWAAAPDEEMCDVDADLALELENYPLSLELHDKVVRAHRDNALAHYHLGFTYGMSGQVAKEISEYLEAVRLGLRKWDLFLNLGIAYLNENDSVRATKALRTAVLLGPDHPEAHFGLALAYERSNKFREAHEEIAVSSRLARKDVREAASAADELPRTPKPSPASAESLEQFDSGPPGNESCCGRQ